MLRTVCALLGAGTFMSSFLMAYAACDDRGVTVQPLLMTLATALIFAAMLFTLAALFVGVPRRH